MKLFKKLTSKNLLCLLFLMIFLFSASLTAAQNKVVVIPLFGDQSRAPSAVAKTGQTAMYRHWDDGHLQMGVSWPVPRFIDNGDGTVTDKLTDLIWLKKVSCASWDLTWSEAIEFANSLYDGWTGDGSGGDCGLSDGSSKGDWRLPNVREVHSLIDYSFPHFISLPQPNPFDFGSVLHAARTSTSLEADPSFTYTIDLHTGEIIIDWKIFSDAAAVAWPVRGGYD